jgi:cytochrome c-type biogenesis protein CcmH
MIAFWICAVLLLLLALALVLPAVLKGKSNPAKTADGAAQANLSVLRSQLTQLDADFAAGSINADQLALAKSEIERRALEEESASESALAVQPAKSTRTAIFVGLAIPLLALGIYGFLGNINALDPANLQAKADADPTPAQIEAMVTQFAERLESQPKDQAPDPKAWEMLARSYAAMQKFPEASKAYKRAVELNPGNAQILADHADVLAMLQGQSMVGEPTKLFERALVLDPNNLKALALAGSAAFEKKDFVKAIALWEKASKLAPPGSDFAKGLASSVDEARAASGAPAVTTKSAPTPAVATASVQGVVSLSPALKSKVAPDDTVFIFARAAQGPRMPLAILKRKASELPITFTLDDSTAMADELKLSKFELVIVGARVSKSGNALPQSGDLVGQSVPIKAGRDKLTLVIDSVQP